MLNIPLVVIGPVPGLPRLPDARDTTCDKCGGLGHIAPSTWALLQEEPSVPKYCFTCATPLMARADITDITGVRGFREFLAEQRHVTPKAKVPTCDFCGEPLGSECWTYHAKPFVVEMIVAKKGDPSDTGSITTNFDSEWAACFGCTNLIRNNDRDGLLRRSARRYIKRVNRQEDFDTLVEEIGTVQRAFWQNRLDTPPTYERL